LVTNFVPGETLPPLALKVMVRELAFTVKVCQSELLYVQLLALADWTRTR